MKTAIYVSLAKNHANILFKLHNQMQSVKKNFFLCHRALVTKLLSQGCKVNRLSNTFKKFYGRHTDLVGHYKKNVCQMFADSIS